MIGGTDITSVTLSYTAWELAKQPALQSKVWQKLWEARSDSGAATFDSHFAPTANFGY
jgi:cytochrome P450